VRREANDKELMKIRKLKTKQNDSYSNFNTVSSDQNSTMSFQKTKKNIPQ
jgi:hypothetical protein